MKKIRIVFLTLGLALCCSCLFAQNQKKRLGMNLIKGDGEISDFLMGNTEVTQKQYLAIMGNAAFDDRGDFNPANGVSFYDAIYFCNLLSIKNGLDPFYGVKDEGDPRKWGYTPGEGNIITEEIQIDAESTGYRLPTEDEWMYAANANSPYKFSGSDNLNEVGTFIGNYKGIMTKVASYAPNKFGLYDMSGNVREWTMTFDEESSKTEDHYRAMGGCVGDPEDACTVISGMSAPASSISYEYGFRVVRSIKK